MSDNSTDWGCLGELVTGTAPDRVRLAGQPYIHAARVSEAVRATFAADVEIEVLEQALSRLDERLLASVELKGRAGDKDA